MKKGYSVHLCKDGVYLMAAWFLTLSDAYTYFDALEDEYDRCNTPVIIVLKDAAGRVYDMVKAYGE